MPVAPKQHEAGPAPAEDPPAPLLSLADGLQHPLVHRTGVTCTSEGRWALYVTVDPDTPVPLPDLEARCHGFPVVYEAEPDKPLTPYSR